MNGEIYLNYARYRSLTNACRGWMAWVLPGIAALEFALGALGYFTGASASEVLRNVITGVFMLAVREASVLLGYRMAGRRAWRYTVTDQAVTIHNHKADTTVRWEAARSIREARDFWVLKLYWIGIGVAIPKAAFGATDLAAIAELINGHRAAASGTA
jgi:hypothetical protein